MSRSHYNDAELRDIATFDDAVRLATVNFDAVTATGARPVGRRVLTTTGIRELVTTAKGSRQVLAHWTAIYAYVLCGEPERLASMRGVQVDGFELECDPVAITQRQEAGELQLPPASPKGCRPQDWQAPWTPREQP